MAMRNRHINTQEPPSCWNYEELSEQEKDFIGRTYWVCWGIPKSNRPQSSRWVHAYITKQDAEAASNAVNPDWEWDKEPAKPTTLYEEMSYAREKGRLGVRVCSWNGKERVIIREFPASMPLEGEW